MFTSSDVFLVVGVVISLTLYSVAFAIRVLNFNTLSIATAKTASINKCIRVENRITANPLKFKYNDN